MERRLAGHVAGQSPPAGVETGGHFHLFPLLIRHSGPQREHALKHDAAIAMNVARGGADLGIGVSGQRFLNKIDESRLALQCASSVIASLRTGGFGADGFGAATLPWVPLARLAARPALRLLFGSPL